MRTSRTDLPQERGGEADPGGGEGKERLTVQRERRKASGD